VTIYRVHQDIGLKSGNEVRKSEAANIAIRSKAHKHSTSGGHGYLRASIRGSSRRKSNGVHIDGLHRGRDFVKSMGYNGT